MGYLFIFPLTLYKGYKMFSKRCREHLAEVDESGLQHMRSALRTAIKLQVLVPVLIIHSIAPRCFTHTASNTMKKLLERLER